MKAALAAAVGDREARAVRRLRLREATAAWQAMPALAGLRARLDRIEGGGEAAIAAALAAARPLLEDARWLRDGIAALVGAAAADPLFEPPLKAISHETQAGLQLFRHARLAITLVVLPLDGVAARKQAPLGPRSIAFSGRRSLMRVMRAAGGIFDLWDAVPAGDDFSAGAALPCLAAGRVALADGDILAFDGARRSWTLAGARGDIVLLQATARSASAPLMVEYDAQSLSYVGASATDGGATRMQMLAGLLRRMERRDAAPTLADAASEGPFYLRWHLARELAALDRDAAVPLLRAMAAGDVHPEIRAAAARTLLLLAA